MKIQFSINFESSILGDGLSSIDISACDTNLKSPDNSEHSGHCVESGEP